MVEGKRRQIAQGENADFNGIISRMGRTVSLSEKYSGYGMEAWVPTGVRVAVHLAKQGNIKPRFLFCFTYRSSLKRLPVINETAGDCPAEWRVLPLDQNNASINFNNDINSWHGISPAGKKSVVMRRIHL